MSEDNGIQTKYEEMKSWLGTPRLVFLDVLEEMHTSGRLFDLYLLDPVLPGGVNAILEEIFLNISTRYAELLEDCLREEKHVKG